MEIVTRLIVIMTILCSCLLACGVGLIYYANWRRKLIKRLLAEKKITVDGLQKSIYHEQIIAFIVGIVVIIGTLVGYGMAMYVLLVLN